MSWYVVHAGWRTGVLSTWEACIIGACYKKYKTREEAVAAFYGPKNEPELKPVVADSKVMMDAATSKDRIILV